MSLNINKDKAQNIFDSLGKDGKTIMPFAEVFWGGKFGMLVDQFGIQWMVSTPH
jgi:PhnB protein